MQSFTTNLCSPMSRTLVWGTICATAVFAVPWQHLTEAAAVFLSCLHVPAKHGLAITSTRVLNQEFVEWKWIPAPLYVL